ncbi:methyltransferase domain-containing protein [Besnoitia besnoiti]|uniref:Methyltransferase domain-containing protein n=1 Tax=Besnoitia besnoiti TaxID=94643 RepID=A0A2A9MPU5_BESBE|nr:methyltransferase domain-containing protein [Besnoitia besnoiti]PFH38117.1 methyltransferase domain-containing protein [Besnoitia besnoiti]
MTQIASASEGLQGSVHPSQDSAVEWKRQTEDEGSRRASETSAAPDAEDKTRRKKEKKKRERAKMASREKTCDPVAEQLLHEGRSAELEREFVGAVYDRIANHFSHTRYKPWPRVRQFLERLPRYSLVVDVGCGNGKYLQCVPRGSPASLPPAASSAPSPSPVSSPSPAPSATPTAPAPAPAPPSCPPESCPSSSADAADPAECLLLGVDMSRPLLVCAQERAHARGRLALGTCLNTNFRQGIADAVISIAVTHHLATEERRVRAIEELARLARPGGLILITVWAERQEEGSIGAREFKGKDVFVPWHLQKALETRQPSAAGAPRQQPADSARDLAACPQTSEAASDCTSVAKGDAARTASPAGAAATSDATQRCAEAQDRPLEAPETPEAVGGGGVASRSGASREDEKRAQKEESEDSITTLFRYYHVFSREEILGLCARVRGVEVVESYFDSNNWAVILRKLL